MEIGIDEVGRGCLAGPMLVVAASQIVSLPEGLADSKVLTRQKREELTVLVLGVCRFVEGWVKASEIDKLGLTAATKLGVRRALKKLGSTTADNLIIDGNINYAPKNYKNVSVVIDADALIPIVSAASIYAKVTRDNFMRQLAKRHRSYGFDTNVGYATKFHLTAISKHGTLKYLHRSSFAPVRIFQESIELW